ncbi:MAG: DUF1559 domain-containing protein [Gemmataceae bacterium]
MAAQVLFKVACPSCDAQIPVRDSKLVGRKVACPTCKYPFVVENPDGFEPIDDDAPAGKPRKGGDDKDGPRKPKKKASNNGMKIGLAVGGVAVVVLLVAGYFLFFSGDESKKTTPQPVAKNRTPDANAAAANPATTTPAPTNVAATPTTEANKEPGKDVENKGAATPPVDAPAAQVAAPPAAPVPTAGTSGDITNVLPNEGVAVTYIDMQRFYFCTAGEQLFESKTGFPPGAFKTALGIDTKDMDKFVRSENIEQKWSFNVIRTVKDKLIDIKEVTKALNPKKGPKSPIQGREYYELPPNAMLDNLTSALMTSGELKERKEKKNDESSVLGMMLLDQSTLVIATMDKLEEFMKGGCKPLEQSKPAKRDPNQPAGGDAPVPPPKRGRGDAAAYSMTMLQAPDDAQLTDSATFLTVDPPIKAMFDRLLTNPVSPPILTHVFLDQADQRLYQRLKGIINVPRIPGVRVVGIMVNEYKLEKFYATVSLEFFNENDVKQLEGIFKKNLERFGKFLGAILGGIKVETEGGDGGGGGGNAPQGKGGGGKAGGGGGESSGIGLGLGLGPADEGPSSKVKLIRKGRALMGVFELNLITRAYERIATLTESIVAKMRGNVDMASPVPLWTELSAAALKLKENQIPTATFLRDDTMGGRLARRHPPEQRVSWMAGLLPHLGYDELYRSLDPRKSWRDDRNLKAGARIIPAFLDPRYPNRSWEARLETLGGRHAAATHYVGMAGIGPDAADYNPDDPAVAKKLGAFNYNRPTALKDVTDGLSNTIYMIQVPPAMDSDGRPVAYGYQRPWVAGGGATVMGAPESRSVRPFVYNHGGKRGTYVIMLDGSVRFISDAISDDVFKAMCTIKGGDTIPNLEGDAPKVKPMNPELKTKPES